LDAARDFADKGEAAFKGGDYYGAVYALRHAAVDDPNNPVVTLLLGQALFATGRFDESAGATQAAMRQLPKEKWGVVISHYTELYGNTKDYTQQLRALEKAVKEKPDDPALRFLAGFHYAHLGFTQPAIDQLDKGLKLAPRDEMARQLRDDLRGKLTKSAVPPVPLVPGVPSGPALETEE
jgi:tetratricopeptide (TPR) repeat protein